MDRTDRSEISTIAIHRINAILAELGPLDAVQVTDAISHPSFLASMVGAAKYAGKSWTEIGAVLGVGRQAAQKRFGRQAALSKVRYDQAVAEGRSLPNPARNGPPTSYGPRSYNYFVQQMDLFCVTEGLACRPPGRESSVHATDRVMEGAHPVHGIRVSNTAEWWLWSGDEGVGSAGMPSTKTFMSFAVKAPEVARLLGMPPGLRFRLEHRRPGAEVLIAVLEGDAERDSAQW